MKASNALALLVSLVLVAAGLVVATTEPLGAQSAEPTIVLDCPDGGELAGDKCMLPSTPTCPNGGTLNGFTCSSTTTGCPPGSTPANSGTECETQVVHPESTVPGLYVPATDARAAIETEYCPGVYEFDLGGVQRCGDPNVPAGASASGGCPANFVGPFSAGPDLQSPGTATITGFMVGDDTVVRFFGQGGVPLGIEVPVTPDANGSVTVSTPPGAFFARGVEYLQHRIGSLDTAPVPVTFRQLPLQCFAELALIPPSPAVAATLATCNGVATTGTAQDCVSTVAGSVETVGVPLTSNTVATSAEFTCDAPFTIDFWTDPPSCVTPARQTVLTPEPTPTATPETSPPPAPLETVVSTSASALCFGERSALMLSADLVQGEPTRVAAQLTRTETQTVDLGVVSGSATTTVTDLDDGIWSVSFVDGNGSPLGSAGIAVRCQRPPAVVAPEAEVEVVAAEAERPADRVVIPTPVPTTGPRFGFVIPTPTPTPEPTPTPTATPTPTPSPTPTPTPSPTPEVEQTTAAPAETIIETSVEEYCIGPRGGFRATAALAQGIPTGVTLLATRHDTTTAPFAPSPLTAEAGTALLDFNDVAIGAYTIQFVGDDGEVIAEDVAVVWCGEETGPDVRRVPVVDCTGVTTWTISGRSIRIDPDTVGGASYQAPAGVDVGDRSLDQFCDGERVATTVVPIVRTTEGDTAANDAVNLTLGFTLVASGLYGIGRRRITRI